LSTLIGAAIPKTLTEDVSFHAFTGTSQVTALINSLQAARIDTDGSERLFVRIELPSGFTLPTNPFVPVAGGALNGVAYRSQTVNGRVVVDIADTPSVGFV
jgi:hypothetical protein